MAEVSKLPPRRLGHAAGQVTAVSSVWGGAGMSWNLWCLQEPHNSLALQASGRGHGRDLWIGGSFQR